ncbi:MAG: hypothetical protein ACREIA_20325, partial [Opitutaceae bacterium]
SPALGELTLAADQTAAGSGSLRVTEEGAGIVVDTGAITCRIPRSGRNLVESIRVGETEIARAGQLVGILQDGPVTYPEDAPRRGRRSLARPHPGRRGFHRGHAILARDGTVAWTQS